MLIICPSCSTSYTIEPGSLGAAGRTVRCVRCKNTWFADATSAVPEMKVTADAEAAESQTFTGVIRPDATNSAVTDEVPAEAAHDDAALEASSPMPVPEAAAIADAPSLVPPMEPPAPPEATASGSDPDEVENFAIRRKRLQAKRQQSRRSSRWTALILVLFAFNVALIGARSEVVRFLPQTASLFSAVGLPVNLRNLKFENMRISKETQEGLSSLVIEGTIVSLTNKPVEVPRLRFAARDAAGQEVYTWTALPTRSILGPGEKQEFRSRFVSPPANAIDVMVRFAGAQDTNSGAK